MPEKRRRFAVYPSCFGRLSLGGLVIVARREGMQVISASKPDMHAFNEIGLFGTPTQKRAVVRTWNLYGNELKPRSFHAHFPVRLDLPRGKWLDVPKTHREWCREEMDRLGTKCRCDYDQGGRIPTKRR